MTLPSGCSACQCDLMRSLQGFCHLPDERKEMGDKTTEAISDVMQSDTAGTSHNNMKRVL